MLQKIGKRKIFACIGVIREKKIEKMGIETEHKYLVKDDSYIELASGSVRMAQGYLSRVPERTVRVRVSGDKGFITVKGINRGASREEYEYEIPVEDAKKLLGLCEEKVISKTRYYVDYQGFTWEVDRFEGDLAPLIVAEIELPSEDTPYPLPPFVGRDVTGDPRYYNSSLSRCENLPPVL